MTRPARPLQPGDAVQGGDHARGVVTRADDDRHVYVRWYLPGDEDTLPAPAEAVR